MELLIQVQYFLLYIVGFCFMCFQPVFFLPIFLYKYVVILFSRLQPKFGKVLTAKDSITGDEDFTKFPPKGTVVNTLVLEGDLSFQDFQSIFVQHVINACIPSSSSSSKPAYFREQSTGYYQTRYPELKQYQTDFMGYKFWKDDAEFSLSNHIREIDHSTNPISLDLIHQEMLNKQFSVKRSPWEIVLIKNYFNDSEDKSKSQWKTLVAARFHHSMADAKSILKLFVECLGQQSLTIAKPHEVDKNMCERICSSRLIFPLRYLYQNIRFLLIMCFRSGSHPWRTPVMGGDNNKLLIRFSPNMSLKEIKDIAKKNDISTSAVLISMITGAIYNLDSELRTKTVLAGYILPLENHPPTLCNHFTGSITQLPTNKHLSTKERLQLCHQLFQDLKTSSMKEFLEAGALQIGTLFNPLRKLVARNAYAIVGITNVAGESKGFSIGQRKCLEFTFSVGTQRGCSGVSFSCSSYQDNFRVAVIANENVLDEGSVKKLANAFGEELEVMKKEEKNNKIKLSSPAKI